MPIMLLRTDRWVADPHVPDEVVGRSFMLLTDAMPVRLDASCTTRDSFRQDVATVVVFLLPRSACPIFLSRRDCPEPLATSASLTNAHSFGAFAGLLQRGRLSLAELLRPLEPFIPDGYAINVLGGSRENGWDGTWLVIWPGQTLLVEPVHHRSPVGPRQHMPTGCICFNLRSGCLLWALLIVLASCLPPATAVQLPLPHPEGHSTLFDAGQGRGGIAHLTSRGSVGSEVLRTVPSVFQPVCAAGSHATTALCGLSRTCDGRPGRPVATPCRAPAPPVEPEYRWHLEVLDTLLDESASLSHDRVGVFGVHPP